MTVISLGCRLLDISSGLPEGGNGPDRTVATTGWLPPPFCLALLRAGFAEPNESPRLLVRSYRTVSPLPLDKLGTGPTAMACPELVEGRFTFCCTFPDLTAGRCYRSPCPVEPGLSSRPRQAWHQRPSGPLGGRLELYRNSRAAAGCRRRFSWNADAKPRRADPVVPAHSVFFGTCRTGIHRFSTRRKKMRSWPADTTHRNTLRAHWL